MGPRPRSAGSRAHCARGLWRARALTRAGKGRSGRRVFGRGLLSSDAASAKCTANFAAHFRMAYREQRRPSYIARREWRGRVTRKKKKKKKKKKVLCVDT